MNKCSKQTIPEFCKTFDYPMDAAHTLCAAWDRIEQAGAEALLEENRQLLFSDSFQTYAAELERLNRIADLTGIHPYTVHLLFYILCAPEAHAQYQARQLPEALWRDAMLDLKWKLQETWQVYGIWGVHCGDWFRPFFTMDRFALGRLQFEVLPSLSDCQLDGGNLRKGDPVINVHIPSCGKLDYGAVLDAYAQAAAFFAPQLPDGPLWFQCETWLLYPRVNALMPDGNLRRFTDDFHVTMAGMDPRQDDRWRVFLMPNDTPIANYPEHTRLQRSLKCWLLEGNQMGIGVGYFRYENGQVLPHTPRPWVGDDTEILIL